MALPRSRRMLKVIHPASAASAPNTTHQSTNVISTAAASAPMFAVSDLRVRWVYNERIDGELQILRILNS
jgi:hypothetical protein